MGDSAWEVADASAWDVTGASSWGVTTGKRALSGRHGELLRELRHLGGEVLGADTLGETQEQGRWWVGVVAVVWMMEGAQVHARLPHGLTHSPLTHVPLTTTTHHHPCPQPPSPWASPPLPASAAPPAVPPSPRLLSLASAGAGRPRPHRSKRGGPRGRTGGEGEMGWG